MSNTYAAQNDRAAFVSHTLSQEHMTPFIAAFATATQTQKDDWIYEPSNSDIGGLSRAHLRNKVTGVSVFIRFSFKGHRIVVSPSLPNFSYGHYTLADLTRRSGDKDTCPSEVSFSIDRLANKPEQVGKEAGKRLGVPLISVWHYVVEKQEAEKKLSNAREAALSFLSSDGWRLTDQKALKTVFATKPGCQDLTVDELGNIRFYSKYISASVEVMAAAAAVLGK